MTEFLDLNDDCLERVFNLCDVETIVNVSKVCKRLNALVTQFQFPKQTTFTCNIRSYTCEERICEILNCIGKYLIELKICQTSEIFLFYRFLGRIIDAERFRKLSIRTPHLSEASLQAIEPILWRLEELELRIANTDLDDDDLDLLSRCPNLRRLHIQWDTSFIQNSGAWPRLQELSLGDNDYISDDTFRDFMQNNPQLRKLKIGAFYCDIQLNDIAQHLINLKQLVIFQNYSDLSVDSVLELAKLRHLQRLVLRNVRTSDFEGIVNSATKLNGLIELQLQAEFDQCSDDEIYEPEQQIIFNIALQMPQLQVFGISFCKLKVETILEFLRFVEHLREIHIHDCDFMLTPDNINAMIKIRSKHRNRIDPLLVYVDFVDSFTHEVSHSLTIDWFSFEKKKKVQLKLVSIISPYRYYKSRISEYT